MVGREGHLGASALLGSPGLSWALLGAPGRSKALSSHSGKVGFRICGDVSHFLSKSMLPLELCDRIDAHARMLERSVSESVMHSQSFHQN